MANIYNIEVIKTAFSQPGSIPSVAEVPLAEQPDYPVSWAQQRLWALYQDEKTSPVYNVLGRLVLEGKLETAVLQAVFKTLIARHESLRTVFVTVESELRQRIQSVEENQFIFEQIDLRGQSATVQHLAEQAALEPFDLVKGPLLRAKLLLVEEQQYVLLLIVHNIISDGWSMQLLLKEIGILYAAYAQRKPNPLPDLKWHYKNFAHWQNQLLKGEPFEQHQRYWLDQLTGELPVLNLATTHDRPTTKTFKRGQITLRVEPSLNQAVDILARRRETSLFMVLLAAVKTLLYRYTGQTDLIVGLPVAGREHPDLEGQVGFFVNTFALRTQPAGEVPFEQYLEQIKQVSLQAYEHQSYPFDKLVEQLQSGRSISLGPLFNVLIQMQDVLPQAEQEDWASVHVKNYTQSWSVVNSDLTFNFSAQGTDRLELVLEYNADLFEQEWIERLSSHYQQLLISITQDSTTSISQLTYLTIPERWQLLEEFSATQTTHPERDTLVSLFEQQVVRTPQALAVIFQDKQLTYQALNEQANQLANYLRERGVKEETLVPICVNHSLEMVVGILGILKAGGAYVPIDPENPEERSLNVLEDILPSVMIIGKEQAIVLENGLKERGLNTNLININEDWEVIKQQSETNVITSLTSSNLAYVIYTSGSTGRPKGVLIEHKSIVNYIINSIQAYSSRNEQNGGSYVHLPLSFDASLTAIFVPLLIGKNIILNSLTALSAFNNDTLLQHGPLDFLKLTPAQLFLIDTAEKKQMRYISKKYIVGGEALQQRHYKFLADDHVDVEIINEYGPTEATVGCVTYKFNVLDDVPIYPNGVLIGKPMPNVSIYILDKFLDSVPTGAAGEMYIGGVQVARGYFNQDELTKEKFLPDSFSTVSGARMYKSGDLARLLPDGNLEYLGRIDEQVKIRGYRIELGEIESVLQQCPGVKHCVVAAKEATGGEKRLIGYVIVEKDFDKRAIISFMQLKLPDYMVPQLLMKLDEIPLTSNGKINRGLLPNPDASELLTSQFTAPNTSVEKNLVDLWKEILSVNQVGIHDNFFELGGNSILALKIVASLKKQYNYNVSVTKLYQFPTVNNLLHYLEGKDRKSLKEIKKNSFKSVNSDVAVIGMAGRFPGANTIEELWDVLKQNKETIRFFTPEELDSSIPDQIKNDPAYVKARGVIDYANQFDANFFGLNPRFAELMDPQQRVFLEIAWEALEQTGYLPGKYEGNIGVYAGSGYNTYLLHNVLPNRQLVDQVGSFQVMTVNEKDYVASRVSYQLNLKGPAVSVHSACSTSLLAIAQAVDSIRNGHCDLALAGGASVTSPINSGHIYQEGSISSPDGHCRSFDADAKGTVFSDGAGVVLLKSLEAARRDGDVVYAVIKGIGVNNDGGGKGSFTAPNAEGQAGAITLALEDAQIDPSTISYVEAHGTATPLGDPIEIEGLTMAFGDQPTKQFCAIGSIKSNMGHLTTAAGVAGFIKTTLALYHKQIPASLGFSVPNPNIDFANSPFFVNTRLAEWQSPGTRRAGVSSFGIGGTNVHVVLEEFEDQLLTPDLDSTMVRRPAQLITWSAKSVASSNAYAEVLANHLLQKSELDLADVAFTLQTTRTDFNHRRFEVANSSSELVDNLLTTSVSLSESELSTETSSREKILQEKPGDVVFLFPGQGVQYLNMGRELYENEAVYQQAVDECAELLNEYLETDIRQVIYPQTTGLEAEERLKNPCYAQPALFVTEYALAKLWMGWGIQPSVFCGQSIGEFVAAHLAGVFTLADALKLVAVRGRLVSGFSGGSMLSVRLEVEKVRAMMPESLSIAVINSPKLCVVSGPDEDITAFAEILDTKEILNRVLLVSYASHSPMMNPIVKDFQKVVESISLSNPQKPIVSTVSGIHLTDAQATDPRYWAEHLRMTVRFADALESIFKLDKPILLEVGPGNVTTIIARQQVDVDRVTVLASLETYKSSQTEYRSILKTLGQLWLNGLDPDWNAFYAGQNRSKVKLPSYVFDRKRCWIDPVKEVPQSVHISPLSNELQPESTAGTQSQHNYIIKRKDVLFGKVKKILKDASGIEMEGIRPGMTFLEIGLDSLLLTQISLTLKKAFNLPISFRQLNEECSTLGLLVAHLDERLPAEAYQPKDIPVSQPASQPTSVSQQAITTQTDVDSALKFITQQLQILTEQVVLLKGGNPVMPWADPAEVPASMNGDRKSALDLTFNNKIKAEKSSESTDQIDHQYVELSDKQQNFIQEIIHHYSRKTQSSKAYSQQHRKADSPVGSVQISPFKEVMYPIAVNKSKGCRLWDVDGNEYIDVLNGIGLDLFNYQAESTKNDHGIGQQDALVQEVSQMVCEFTGYDQVALCDTGTEALLGAIQTARTVTNRSLLIAFTGSYLTTASEDVVKRIKELEPSLIVPNRTTKDAQDILILEYGTDTSLNIIKERASELAAVLVEPIQSHRSESKFIEFLKQVRVITEASGTALIFDEVISGIRMHPKSVQTIFGIKADLVSYSKLIGEELPIGIVTGKSKFMDSFDGGFKQRNDTSVSRIEITHVKDNFVRNPLTLAAARLSLQHMKKVNPDLQKSLATKAQQLAEVINTELEQQQLPIFIAQFGSSWKIKFTEEIPYSDLLFTLMRKEGIHIWNDFPCSITESHTLDDISQIIKALFDSINKLVDAGFLKAHSKGTVSNKDNDLQYYLNEPPTSEAKIGRDREGNLAWFISNPSQLGKYFQIEL